MVCNKCGYKSYIMHNTGKYGDLCSSCYRSFEIEREGGALEDIYKRYGLVKNEQGEWVYE